MAKKNPADYEVGYGKPPEQTRFKPGQSGNPKGRHKGTKNLRTDLLEELGERIPIREGDRLRRVSKQRAMVKTLMARTLKGDARAANLVLGLMTRLIDPAHGEADDTMPMPAEELEVLRAYTERVKRAALSARKRKSRSRKPAP